MTKPTLGLIAGDLTNPYGKLVRETLSEAFAGEGYELIAESLSGSRTLSTIASQWCSLPSFRGLVVAVASSLDNDSAIDRLSFEQERRIVLVGSEHPQVDSVSADFEEGGFIATKHLIEQGHRRIAFVGAEFSDARRVARLRGYLNALNTYGLPVRPDSVVGLGQGPTGSFATRETGKRAVEILMNLPQAPTAIFARNDYVALGALDALHRLDVAVPSAVSLVGFDGIAEGAQAQPPLTSVIQPTVAQARVAAEYLLYRVQNSETRLPPRRTVMSCRLNVRASTATVPTSRGE